MKNSLITIVFVAAAMQACARDTFPTSPGSGSRVPNVEISQLRLTGTVTNEDGAPVSGVSVKIYRWPSGPQTVTTFTDSDGTYDVSLLSSTGVSAFTEKAGYQSEWHNLDVSRGIYFQWDLKIHRK